MTLIFDTSILIGIEQNDKKLIGALKDLIKVHSDPAQITFITYFEYFYGLRNKSWKNKNKSLNFLKKFNMLNLTGKTAEILSELKDTLEQKGTVLPLADLLIASQAIESNMILVTKDKDFDLIPPLKKIIL